MTEEHRDTVVVADDRGSSGMGVIVGIIAVLVLLAAVWWVALGPGANSSRTTNTNTINGGNAPAATQQAPAATAAPAAS